MLIKWKFDLKLTNCIKKWHDWIASGCCFRYCISVERGNDWYLLESIKILKKNDNYATIHLKFVQNNTSWFYG